MRRARPGAVVAYAATASDNIDPSPGLTCAPASGSVFPTGSTTVTCSARDSSGNVTVGSFTIRVRGTAQQIVRLIAKTLTFLELPALAEALTARLGAVADTPLANRARTCTAIRAYRIVVSQLPAILLARTEKAELLADAARISAVVGC